MGDIDDGGGYPCVGVRHVGNLCTFPSVLCEPKTVLMKIKQFRNELELGGLASGFITF